MAEVIEGKKVILLFRLVKERATKTATQLAYEISNTLNRERNTEEQETKTGDCTVTIVVRKVPFRVIFQIIQT